MTSTAASPAAAQSFSALIRARSWALHQEAEGSGFLDELMRGDLVRDAYTAMVAQHHHAYAVLEEAADVMRQEPVAAPFADRALDRMAALDADMAFLAGDDWRASDRWAPNAATQRYVARLREVCFTWPGAFVAHHYTRYLGDMSGGQFIAARMRDVYGLPGSSGTAFYDFTAVGDLAAFKDAYRAGLDAASWDAAERALIVEEILEAYRINSAVLADLGADLPQWRRAS